MATKSRRGIIKNQDVSATTFVVGANLAVADFTTIDQALANLPAEGGSIFLLEGTFPIAATITIPAKPVRIVGAGRDATKIDLGSNAIAAFTLASDDAFSFSDFSIDGDGTAAQIGFDVGAAVAGTFLTAITRVNITQVDVNVSVNGGAFPVFDVFESIWIASVLASRRTWTGPGEFRAIRCDFENGGILGSPSVQFTNCFIELDTGATVEQCEIENSELRISGALPLSINSSATATCSLIGVNFRSSAATRAVDIVLNGSGVISGCVFEGTWSAEAIRIAGSGYVINDNAGNCDVTEIGAADNNHYANNEGFESSTIIGPQSIVEDANTRTVTTTPVTLDRTDKTILVDSSGGNRVINLPLTASAIYHIFIIKKIAAANTVTIDASGAETIDGSLTQVLSADDEVITIQSDGTEWRIIDQSASMAVREVLFIDGTGGQTTVAGTGLNIDFDTREKEIGASFITIALPGANFTVDESGDYYIEASVGCENTSANDAFRMVIQRDPLGGGAFADIPGTFSASGQIDNGDGEEGNVHAFAELAITATDEIRIQISRRDGAGVFVTLADYSRIRFVKK